MPTTLVQIAYRPARVAWLVRGRSIRDVRSAIALASCLWGGRFGIIADAAAPASRLDLTLRRSGVDILHPISDGLDDVVARNRHLAWPLVGRGVVGERGELRLIDFERGLRLLSSERRVDSAPVLPTWEEDDPYTHIYAATFGDLRGDGVAALQRGAFVRMLAPSSTPAAVVAASLDRSLTPWRASGAGLRWYQPFSISREVAGVFLGSRRSVRDIRALWNLRAVGIDVVFWDVLSPDGGPFAACALKRVAGASQDFEATDIPVPFRRFPCYAITGTGRPDRVQLPEALANAISNDRLTPGLVPLRDDVSVTEEWLADDERHLPATPEESVVAHVEDRGEERSYLVVQLPRTPLSDAEGDARISQEVGIHVSVYGDSGYRGTLNLPHLQDLNNWYRDHLFLSKFVRVHPDGFTLLTPLWGTTVDLHTASRSELAHKLMDRAGIEIKRSLPGEAAQQLIEQFGGYGGLRVLRIPGVRRLLSSPQARRGIIRGTAQTQIQDGGTFAEADPIFGFRGSTMTPAAVWEYLLHHRIFLPGVETKCPRCHHQSFYPPREIADDLQCPKCAQVFPLGPALRGDPLRFRLTGLLQEREDAGTAAMDPGERHQPSAVPVLLTLSFLSEWVSAHDGAVFETSHTLVGEFGKCECDVLVITYGPREEAPVHVLLGECKGQGRVEREDVANLTQAAAQVRASGLACDLVFATTRPAFTNDELDLFRECYEESSDHPFLRRAPLFLTSEELDRERYSQRSPMQGNDLHGYGIDPLVRWATRKLVPGAIIA